MSSIASPSAHAVSPAIMTPKAGALGIARRYQANKASKAEIPPATTKSIASAFI